MRFVRNVCNHWISIKDIKFCPNEIRQLVIQFMPKLNVTPIALALIDRDYSDWNQQMKNKQNEQLPK